MSLVLGAQMVRLDDGMKGVVTADSGELRIRFVDRGEALIAEKKEKWVPADPPPRALRLEEIAEVARAADYTLKALELHLPNRLWLSHRDDEIHDAGLVRVISEYLRQR